MSTLARRLWPLGLIGVNGRTAVLGAALRACAPDEASGLAEALLRIARRRRDGLAVPHLVARWGLLTEGQRSEVASMVGTDWPELAAYVAQDSDPLARAGVARACGETGGLGALAGMVVVGLLADADERVAIEAEQALGLFMQGLADRAFDAAGQSAARAAADGAIETFDRHRRTGALRAAIRHGLVTRGGRAGGRWMTDADHPAHMVVRGLIRTSNDPEMRSCAWAWLKYPSLATACAERLTRADSLAEQSVVLERSHLALNPQREAGLVSSNRVDVRAFAGALPGLSQIDGLGVEARRGLARWIAAVPVGARLRDAASAVILTDDDAGVRQSLALSAASAERPPACLLDLVFDADETVAGTAADAVLSRGAGESLPDGQRERLLSVIARSSHGSLRHLAAQATQRPGGAARADALAEAVRLTERMINGGAEAEGLSPRSAASAVAAIGAAADPPAQAEPLLLRAAGLPDARVRANAIEGLMRRVRSRREGASSVESEVVGLLLDRATDPNHRIRANAARGLLVCGWAADRAGEGEAEHRARATLAAAGSRTLEALLADGRTMHRVAGLWLAHRVGDAVQRSGAGDGGHGSLLERVSFVTGRAIDPLERAWGERACRRLETSLRERWSKQAVAFEEVAA